MSFISAIREGCPSAWRTAFAMKNDIGSKQRFAPQTTKFNDFPPDRRSFSPSSIAYPKRLAQGQRMMNYLH